MRKWEYLVIQLVIQDMYNGNLKRPNELGEQGWELVTIDENHYAFFKRPKS